MAPQVAFALFVTALAANAAARPDGEALYRTNCAGCHETLPLRVTDRATLQAMSSDYVLRIITEGVMRFKAAGLTPAQRVAVAEYVGGEPVTKRDSPLPNRCAGSPSQLPSGSEWSAWGADLANSRFQPSPGAGLSAGEVDSGGKMGGLQLKWAFAFPDSYAAWSQPAVARDRVFVASAIGNVYSLDARTGCTWWVFDAGAEVRSAIVVGPDGVAYFGDLRGNAFALDALTGKLIWKTSIDQHPFARITGTPQLYNGRLYVPVASRSEDLAIDETIRCCTFRGSVASLDAKTGKVLWKTWTIDEPAKPISESRAGFPVAGPSGVGVWCAPTIDPKRGVLYVGTGNNYSDPATSLSDSILALDLQTGAIRWARQMTAGDALNGGCFRAGLRNCSKETGPDYDFAASPVLTKLPDGRSLLLAAQKSGTVFALDPDNKGHKVWQTRVGEGGLLGSIVFGPASGEGMMWVAVSDLAFRAGASGSELDPTAGGSLAALRVADGKIIWRAGHVTGSCERPGCSPARPAAVTAIPGVVFSGSMDGHFRAYASKTGKLLFDYDTIRDYSAVNGGTARGGSMNGGGAAVAGGMVFVGSGYGFYFGFPGSVLLAFGTN